MQTGSPSLTLAERRIRRGELALALRQAGKTFAAIGLELGCSGTRAHQIVRRAAKVRWADGLPGRVRTFLHQAGFTGLPEIEAACAVARLSRRKLLSTPNIGNTACDAVVVWLARHRLELNEKSAPVEERPSEFIGCNIAHGED